MTRRPRRALSARCSARADAHPRVRDTRSASTRSPRSATSAAPRPSAPDPAVRAAAARALRFVPDVEADRLLLATLRRDREPTVRAAALFAAGFRPIEPLADGLSETALSDPIEYVRANAVAVLARHPGASPRAARALGFVARNDPAPAVRQLAQQARPVPGASPDADAPR